jgi:hypothetical protein
MFFDSSLNSIRNTQLFYLSFVPNLLQQPSQQLLNITSMADSIVDSLEPLTGREIRLIEIYPSELASDVIKCRRFRVNLDDIWMYPYEALSYVWGDGTSKTDIICNGLPVSVTVSLLHALKRLRLAQGFRLIWADAICIDQSNFLEKNHQIPLMGKIYSLAERVAIWLGEVDPTQSRGICEIVQRITEHIRKTIREWGYDEASMRGYERLQMPSYCTTTAAQEVLTRLYAMPWFSRVWCIQEVVLAKDAIMFWGEHELSWADIGLIATWLSEITPQRALEYDSNAFYADVEVGNAFRMYRFRERKLSGFIDLLDDCVTFEATNPRDRVYGLLALLEANKEAQALSVDYEKSFEEVYADTVVAVIQVSLDLNPLKYVNHGISYRRTEQNFTSWTPNWHDKIGIRRMPAHGSPLSACKNLVVTSADTSKINSKHLCLEGLLYSEVTSVHVVMDLDSLENLREHPFLENYSALFGPEETCSVGELSKMFALARTLTAGCNSSLEDIIDANKEEQGTFYRSFLTVIRMLNAGVDTMNFRKDLPFEESFYDEAEIVCTNRRLFQTANGNFGLGPTAARKGDIVVVLFGGDTPYILRPCGTSYSFIGQAYVDSLMQGELVDQMEVGRVQKQEFCLV